MKKITEKIKELIYFLKTGVWSAKLDELPKKKAFLYKQIRIVSLVLQGFKEDQCALRASSLTFYSLLSIVPILAMAFGIAKGFGLEKTFEKQLESGFGEQQIVLEKVLEFAQSMLENTKGGLIAGIGLLLLFYTIMKLLNHIENAFNDIWEVREPRTLYRKFTDYLSIMILSPILMIIASSLSVVIASKIKHLTQDTEMLQFATPFILSLLKLIPYTLVWLGFTVVYYIMPNLKVKIKSAFLAGIIGGSLYQIVQFTYINSQMGMSQNNAVYGSFAALPLFLVWMQLSWLIVLIGAQFSYAIQNYKRHEFQTDYNDVSNNYQQLTALMILHKVIKNFEKDQPALNEQQIAQGIRAPIYFVQEILEKLVDCHIINKVVYHKDSITYQPALPIDKISIQHVVNKLDNHGLNAIRTIENEAYKQFENYLEERQQHKKFTTNKLIKDIEE